MVLSLTSFALTVTVGSDPAHTNPNSPANGDAASDWKIIRYGGEKQSIPTQDNIILDDLLQQLGYEW